MQDSARQLPLFDVARDEPGPKPGLSVRPSNRAKRLSIKVFPRGRVEVVVPRRTSSRAVKAFIEENRDWIQRARDSFSRNFTPESFALPREILLPTIAARISVRYLPEAGANTVRYRFSNETVTLTGDTANEQLCVDALKRWLSGLARQAFEPRLQALARLTEIPYTRIHIRMQRTCWGSRSSTGTVSLNLCLLFLAPELTRYLLIHELCHGRHMNHSKRFWTLVSRFEPAFKTLDRRLGESWRDVPNWLGIY
ncbi:MAG: SprT family zinc-dependent metalloprotease [Proteobacteria bacterium]|nr:SprT family zinc-dependent metalloprotease [Pseudomonadota bacterium]MDA0993468.1 SprT family zinc-dependent metalloprotease [Pseudomonadota bacterium]